MRSGAALIAVAVTIAPAVRMAGAAESVSATITVTATFSSRTSLKVSSQVLEFDVADPGQPASASVDFAAGTRTQRDAEVLLAVEALRTIDGRGGSAHAESSVTFEGEGQGTYSGTLRAASPSVAGRWTGSGLRNGRVIFALRASERGSYTVPVRFVLTAP